MLRRSSQMADLINHTARWVATNGPEFEVTLRTTGGRQEFAFLGEGASSLPAAYYRNRLRFELDVLSAQPAATGMGSVSPEERLGISISEFHDFAEVEAQAAEPVSAEGLGGKLAEARSKHGKAVGADGATTPDDGRRKRSLFTGAGKQTR
jgi:hypothetical protein